MLRSLRTFLALRAFRRAARNADAYRAAPYWNVTVQRAYDTTELALAGKLADAIAAAY
jgi:hypothetical protein